MRNLFIYLRKFCFLVTKAILNLNFKIIIRGKENIPQANNALVVANHSSYLDVFVVGLALYNNLINIRWVISKGNYRLWFLKWLYAIYRVIVVNGTVEKIKAALKEDKWVVIFPEGAKRWCLSDKNFRAKKYKGAAVIALSTGVTLVPIYISGADKALAPESFKLNREYPITVTIGKPFTFEIIHQDKIDDSLLEKTADEIIQHIGCLTEEVDKS